jgi:hypothetical protein
MLGNAVTGVLAGFVGTQTSSPSLTINVTQGWIYQQAPVDAIVYGALAADSTIVMQQGFAAAGQLTFSTAALSGGESQWALVQCQFGQTDVIRALDPNGGILPYINVANPNVPWQGPNNSGLSQPSERLGVCNFNIKLGLPEATGSQVAPLPDSGFLPLFLVDLHFGQTTISTGQIFIAGPTIDPNSLSYPSAPYFPGVIGHVPGSSGSHHGGVAGQAAKVLLTGGAEVQGVLAFPNAPVTNTAPNGVGVGGVVSVAQLICIIGFCTGNPNGLVPGQLGDTLFNPTGGVLYVCIVAGIAAVAVWTALGQGGISTVETANFSVTGGNFIYLANTAGGAIVAQLPIALSMGGTGASFANIGSNTLTITPQSGESINGLSVGTSIVLLPGSGISLASRSGTGFYTLTPQLQYNIITKSASFNATDPSGTLYVVTAAATATLPAAIGSGQTRSYRMAPSAGIGVGLTFHTTGSDTIISGGDLCNTGGTNVNPLFIPDYTSGVVEIIDYQSGQWTQK